jgi:hypothetical protein
VQAGKLVTRRSPGLPLLRGRYSRGGAELRDTLPRARRPGSAPPAAGSAGSAVHQNWTALIGCWPPSTPPPARRGRSQGGSDGQRRRSQQQIRAAAGALLRGELPPGGKCDIPTLTCQAGISAPRSTAATATSKPSSTNNSPGCATAGWPPTPRRPDPWPTASPLFTRRPAAPRHLLAVREGTANARGDSRRLPGRRFASELRTI